MANWGDNFRRGNVPLRVIDAAGAVKVFSLAVSGLKIGSARDAELVLDDPHVAPQHCRIVRRGSDWLLIDHGTSPLGTSVNHRRIHEPTVLGEGDRIGVGTYIIEVAPARLQVDPDLVPDKVRYSGGPWGGENDELLRLAQSAAAWARHRRPRRLLPDAERLNRAVELDAVAPLEPLTRTWVLAGAARRRRWQGLRWLGMGLLPGLVAGAMIVAPAIETPPSPPEKQSKRAADLAPPPSQFAPTPQAPPAPLAPRAVEHEVVPGETLEKIATLYTVRPEWLVRWNPGLALDRPLQQGTLLRVETDRPGERRVRRCVTLTRPDSWESLARRLGIDAATLRAYNPRARDVLRVGEVVIYFVREFSEPTPSAARAVPEVNDLAISRGKPTQADLGDQELAAFPDSPYYDLRCPAHAYASSHTIDKLLGALTDLRGRYDGQLIIGDLSREAGGAYGHHASHQTGRDVDIWLPVLGGCYRATPDCEHCRTPWCRPQTDEIDWAATWDLITALRATGAVQNIFLDRSLHPELRAAAEAAGLSAPEVAATIRSEPGAVAPVSHSNNHTQHIHVRFRCGPDEPGCQR